MASNLRLDPELAEIVAAARQRAIESGEIGGPPPGPFVSPFPPAVRKVVADWLRSGGYDEAVARVCAEDPELATQ